MRYSAASGDLVITPNYWGSAPNMGEFQIGGTGFAPNVWVDIRQYYYAAAARIAVRDQHGELKWLLSWGAPEISISV